ncbi:MAG TPA: sigma-70 family RNA polymerase sigma factor [Polyangiaceae bacterium]|nr:sigma-70 family RNA polymerase sigma factor [Polyangiaceae bacterium]
MKAVGHQQLLAKAACGDDEALALLVRQYHDRVYRFGLRVCRDSYDADDAVQEAFTKLSRRPDVVRDAGALSWLMSVIKHACLRMLRRVSRERRSLGDRIEDADEIASPQDDPRHAIERWQLVQAVHRAIAGLERPYREILILRDLEGLSGAETCAALGLELATMKTRLHRARSRLRAALERSDGVETRGELN